MSSEVAHSFARAPYFIVSTGGIENFTLLENTARNLGSTAGIETAEMLIHSGIDVLITGNLGARASETLEGAGIRVHAGCSGKVSEALASVYLESSLKPKEQATRDALRVLAHRGSSNRRGNDDDI